MTNTRSLTTVNAEIRAWLTVAANAQEQINTLQAERDTIERDGDPALHPTPLKWKRASAGGYYADDAEQKHRYRVQKPQGEKEWVLEVFELDEVGTTDPILVGGDSIDVLGVMETMTLCTTMAEHWRVQPAGPNRNFDAGMAAHRAWRRDHAV
jgi:hypothetical protein